MEQPEQNDRSDLISVLSWFSNTERQA